MKVENRVFHQRGSIRLCSLERTLHKIESDVSSIQEQKDKPQSDVSATKLDALISGVANLSLDTRNIAKEFALLNLLDYRKRAERGDCIPVAHQNTFSWVLSELDCESWEMNNFTRWLLDGTGPFWISGKPGSGKSTLMKFISESPETLAILKEGSWSHAMPVVLARHYFWSAGTPIQQSQEGLMRSLIYDVLSEAPELIPMICPKEWSMPLVALQSLRRPWSISDFRSMLQNLAARPQLPVRLCFFIDGLDEYAGDHQELCETLLALAQSSYFKICISSRPWNVFEDHFGANDGTKLYIHELTHDDIHSFTSSRLYDHYRANTVDGDSETISSFVDIITLRAEGVFLWVFLVTRELRDGLENGDSSADLYERLELFPADLESFFMHLLNSVSSFYHRKMAMTLRVALAANKPLHALRYVFVERDLEDDTFALQESVRTLSDKQIASMIKTLSRKLNARCKGLLEIHNASVQFLHRTVRDFLKTTDMASFLEEKTSQSVFNPTISLFRIALVHMKRTKFACANYTQSSDTIENSDLIESVDEVLDYASSCQGHPQSQALLDEVENVLGILSKTGQASALDYKPVFRERVLQFNLHRYASEKVSLSKAYFSRLDKPPIHVVVQDVLMRESSYAAAWETRLQILQCLLNQRPGPNQAFFSQVLGCMTSPWAELIEQTCPNVSGWEATSAFDCVAKFSATLQTGVFALFIRNGADVNAATVRASKSHRHPPIVMPTWFRFLLSPFKNKDLCLKRHRCKQYMYVLHNMLNSRPLLHWLSQNSLLSQDMLVERIVSPAEFLTEILWDLEVDEQRREFLAEILLELAKCPGSNSLPWTAMMPAIDFAFSPEQAGLIRKTFSTTRNTKAEQDSQCGSKRGGQETLCKGRKKLKRGAS